VRTLRCHALGRGRIAPGGDSHGTKGEYESKGLSQAKSCLLSRAAHARCLLLTQGLERLAGRGVQRKKGRRILRIPKAEMHGNQEALLFQSQCDAAL
jgi:hypothetical protein